MYYIKCFQVCFSHRKQDKHQLQRFLSRPLPENRWQITQRNQRVASMFFQDHPSNSFKTMARCTCTKTPFKTPAKDTPGRREQGRHKSTSFKTISVNSIRVIREKDNANRVSDMVKNRGRETSLKTMAKSGRKKVSFQDMEHEVSKATSFKTIDKSGTNQFPFKTIDKSGTK